jgi:hypothetical protein
MTETTGKAGSGERESSVEQSGAAEPKGRAVTPAATVPPPDALQSIRNVIADDAYAMTFQTMGQYRTFLLHYVDSWITETA